MRLLFLTAKEKVALGAFVKSAFKNYRQVEGKA